jgi:hypothetical protein
MLARIWEENEPLYIASRNVNYRNHYGNHYAGSLKTKCINYLDPAIPPLGIYLKEYKIYRETPAHSCLYSTTHNTQHVNSS